MNWTDLARRSPSLKRRGIWPFKESRTEAAIRALGDGPGVALTVATIRNIEGEIKVRRVNVLGKAGTYDGATVEEALYAAAQAVIG